MSWFVMLIVQPLLIRYNKNTIHRNLGKLGQAWLFLNQLPMNNYEFRITVKYRLPTEGHVIEGDTSAYVSAYAKDDARQKWQYAKTKNS